MVIDLPCFCFLLLFVLRHASTSWHLSCIQVSFAFFISVWFFIWSPYSLGPLVRLSFFQVSSLVITIKDLRGNPGLPLPVRARLGTRKTGLSPPPPQYFNTDRSKGGTSVMFPYCYLFLLSVFIIWFIYYVSDIFIYLGKSFSFGLPRVPLVNCFQFMHLVISLSVLRAG